MKWGEIYYCDLGNSKGSVQAKLRPVLIIQNNVGNRNGPTTVVAAISSVIKKMYLPTHILLDADCGLTERSIVMLEQIRTIDRKNELKEYVGGPSPLPASFPSWHVPYRNPIRGQGRSQLLQ